MTENKIILGGIVKNIQSSIRVILPFFEELKVKIPRLEIFLYENNSNDSTKEFLDFIQKSFEWIHVKCEDLSNSFFFERGNARTWDNKPCRIEMIAYARNQLIEMVEAKNLSRNDFFILMDLDMKIPPSIEQIEFVLKNYPNEVDVLFANGLHSSGKYYDGYELRTEEHPFGPEILGEEFWSKKHMDKILRRIEIDEPLVPVVSAFGGLAIYRGDVFKGCRYSADVTDELHEFYLTKELPADNKNITTHNEGVLLGCYLKDDTIFYKNNSGYNYPVCAEHVNFHLQIRKKGYKNMFICPFLHYYWY
jgi:hypothetical protein